MLMEERTSLTAPPVGPLWRSLFFFFCWSTRRQQIQIKNFYAKLCEKVSQVLYILSINQLCIWKILCLICFSFASAAYLICLHSIIYLILGIFPAQQAQFSKTTHTHTQELLRLQTNCLAAFACLRPTLSLSLFIVSLNAFVETCGR